MISVIDEGYWDAAVSNLFPFEFDWIGVDRLGQVGLFSSGNVGYIPAKVLTSYDLYSQFMEVINALSSNSKFTTVYEGAGDMSYWEDITKMGLWTFDYEDINGTKGLDRYDLIAKPIPPINISQIFPINDFKAMIPVFNLEFNGNITFEELQQNEY